MDPPPVDETNAGQLQAGDGVRFGSGARMIRARRATS